MEIHEEPVSVLLCTYNRPLQLRKALLSLSRQTIGPDRFEVIVVDDGSEERTASVCRFMKKELPCLRFIRMETNKGLGFARNVAVSSAASEYLLFMDDDCLAETDWVEKMSKMLKKHSLLAGTILSTEESYIEHCHNISQFHPFMGRKRTRVVPFIPGANMGLQKSLIREMKGFNTRRRIASEMEFILRSRVRGHKIFFTPQAGVVHMPSRRRFSDVWAHSVRHARVTILLRREYRLLLKTPWILRRPWWLLFFSPAIAFYKTMEIYLSSTYLSKNFHTFPMVFLLKAAWCWGAFLGLMGKGRE
ncbi:MAG: glycosyltransferase family 2 protein [Candidatus Aminicenantes bacterium]|nr:glycosyltransferase family 2 protein [Candidatus Aminicenantes bacterium]